MICGMIGTILSAVAAVAAIGCASVALADFLSGEGTLVVRRPKGLALILK